MRKYSEALRKLYKVNLFKEKKDNLDTMVKAAELIGNPQKDLKFIHVAGTNGKGSVVTKLAKVFELSGYRTGLYISPHISTFRERIQVNGKLIEQEFVADCLEDLFALSEKFHLDLTYFDYVTLMAFQHFKQAKVDIVSLETGLGGRLDATNIVDPLVSVITSIGLDHVDSLGPTIHHIANEKAGIIKQNRPVILGPCLPEEVFEIKAKQMQAPLFTLKADQYTVRDFNNENIRIAREALRVITEKYPEFNKINDKAIEEGMKAAQPCRLEYVDTSNSDDKRIKNKTIVLDVAHNQPAIEKCMLTLMQKHQGKKLRVIFGSSGHKDTYGCLQVLKDYASKIHIVQAKHSRAKNIQELLEQVEQVKAELIEEKGKEAFEDVINDGDITSTIDDALFKVKEDEVIVILGSFYIMAEVRQYLKYNDDIDPVF